MKVLQHLQHSEGTATFAAFIRSPQHLQKLLRSLQYLQRFESTATFSLADCHMKLSRFQKAFYPKRANQSADQIHLCALSQQSFGYLLHCLYPCFRVNDLCTLCKSKLRLLTHVKVSVRCLFKG